MENLGNTIKMTLLGGFAWLFLFFSVYANENSLEAARVGFEQRWEKFASNRTFPVWRKSEEESVLRDRFEQIGRDRWSVYFINPEDFDKGIGRYLDEYATPDREGWHSRYPFPLTFQYNLAYPGYDASVIWLGDRCFIAAEAPSLGNYELFYQMLNQYRVTDLVRLVPMRDGEREGCYPYWEGRLAIHPDDGRLAIHLFEKDIRYYVSDRWKNHQAHDVDRLLALLKAVREQKDSTVAVHCRAGVGRTGVFIASFALLQKVDEQLAEGKDLEISVDRIVWQLSLQRPFTITRFSQYEMLYRLLDAYLDEKEKAMP